MAAIFTMVQNETHFLKKWVEYYSAAFLPEDMYILSHDNYAGNPCFDLLEVVAADFGCTIINVSHPWSYDHVWMQQTVQKFQHFLLQSNETVVYTGADQYLVPLNEGMTLQNYLSSYDEYSRDLYLVPQGYEVVHGDDESPLQLSDPWLEQRNYWYKCKTYTRPLITKIPLYWRPMLQGAYNVPEDAVNEQLALIHMHRVDFNMCLRRHREAAARIWKPEHRQEGPYRHNRVEDPDMLSRWIKCNSDDTKNFAKFEKIPDSVKGAL